MEKVELYSGVSCSSSRKAKQYLEDNNIPFEEIKLPKMELTRTFVYRLLSLTDEGTDEILKANKHENYENATMRQLVDDIIENPKLLRTPIIIRTSIKEKTIVNEQMIVGFNEEEMRVLIPREIKLNYFKETKRLIAV